MKGTERWRRGRSSIRTHLSALQQLDRSVLCLKIESLLPVPSKGFGAPKTDLHPHKLFGIMLDGKKVLLVESNDFATVEEMAASLQQKGAAK